MKLFGRDKPKAGPERRSGPRARVDCAATFIMPSGDVSGRLFDISEYGARVFCDNPPSKGMAAILEWPHGEAYCHVTWSKPGMCGLQFDRPLAADTLAETIEQSPAGPRLVHAAAEGSTPLGAARPRKRFC